MDETNNYFNIVTFENNLLVKDFSEMYTYQFCKLKRI